MISVDLATAIADGVTVITPNKRLARRISLDYAAAEMATGKRAWAEPRVMPWSAWLENLWLEALAAGALDEPRPPLRPLAAGFLWERIVGQDGGLLTVRGAADLARDAWSTFHAWRRRDEFFDAWAHSDISDDAASFARWGIAYRKALAGAGRIDAANLADVVCAAAAAVPAWRSLKIVLAGFVDQSVQQTRLVDALDAAGATIFRVSLPAARVDNCLRVTAPHREAELIQAMEYARTRVQEDPAMRIGIVIPDLAERRGAVLAAADDVLCPEIALAPWSDRPRPYGVSLGIALADVPLICTALDLVEWSVRPLPVGRAAALLRSAYLPGDAVAWMRRAMVERGWRDTGATAVTLADAAQALGAGPDPVLARTWSAAVAPSSRRQGARGWATMWQDWLTALGWPGERKLSSHEWQAREAWAELLGDFSELATVAPVLSCDEAITALRAAATRAVFQPETPEAPIQILGVLEASGLAFDGLWLAGMSAQRWPPAASPNPLLPLPWQRAREVPRADPAQALAFSRTLTELFAKSATEVIASHALIEDSQECAGSPLVASWPSAPGERFAHEGGYTRLLAAHPERMDRVVDTHGAELPMGTVARGGVDIVERQSACPFQAFARHRLGADEWPELAVGLTARERGSLLHRAMSAFWHPHDGPETLTALDATALDARIEAAAEAACASIARSRWRALPAIVASGERRRLMATIATWLDSVERERPPYRVLANESKATLALGGLTLRFRIDRIDAIGEGVAIIDYKSGLAPVPGRWFASRPSGTQLGQYALAQRECAPELPVRTLVYGQLKGGATKAVGFTADADAWPGLTTPDRIRHLSLGDWAAAAAHWRDAYGLLAADFRAGRAEVLPRGPDACRHCTYPAVCRIRAVNADSADDETTDDHG